VFSTKPHSNDILTKKFAAAIHSPSLQCFNQLISDKFNNIEVKYETNMEVKMTKSKYLLVSVMNVVTAASPDPFLPEIFRPFGLRAAARGQLAVSAAAGNAVNDPGRGHGVSKSGLLRG